MISKIILVSLILFAAFQVASSACSVDCTAGINGECIIFPDSSEYCSCKSGRADAAEACDTAVDGGCTFATIDCQNRQNSPVSFTSLCRSTGRAFDSPRLMSQSKTSVNGLFEICLMITRWLPFHKTRGTASKVPSFCDLQRILRFQNSELQCTKWEIPYPLLEHVTGNRIRASSRITILVN